MADLGQHAIVRHGFTLILAFGLTANAEPPANDLPAEVERLVRELDSDTRGARLAAERRLRELGPRVLPLLPAPELVGTGARESLTKIRFELERRQARDSVQPARASLQKTGVVETRLTRLARDTGNPVDLSLVPEDVRRKAVAVQEADSPRTFWDALYAVCDPAGLEPGERKATGALVLRPRLAEPLARSLSGAFAATVVSAQRRDGLIEGEDLLRLAVSFSSEPRLRPLFLTYAAQDIRAGRLEPLSSDAKYEVLLAEGSRPATIQCDFRWPRSMTQESVDLAAQFNVTVAAGSESIRFTGLAAMLGKKRVDVARRRGGVTVTLQKLALEIKEDTQELRVQARVAYDFGGPAFESHRAWLLHNRVFLDLGGGQTLDLNGGLETSHEADGSLVATYVFRDVPATLADVAFVYVAPTLITEVPVRFEFEKVALPR